MKWVAISGSWRTKDEHVFQDVRNRVNEILKAGNGIVVGGALGVDFVATNEALQHDPYAKLVKIILPSSLSLYADHYRMRADEGVITSAEAEALISQLKSIKTANSDALIEMNYTAVNQESYYARNTEVINLANELVAFHVNNTGGTADAIEKARDAGKKIKVYKYTTQPL